MHTIPMRTIARTLIFGLTILLAIPAQSQQIIRVGGYPFSPFVIKEQGNYRGITLDFIRALNDSQQRYRFEFVPTTAATRYTAFRHNRFDIMLFENQQWGWQPYAIDFIPTTLLDGDVMVALNQPGRDLTLFEHPEQRALIAVEGYHYGFADFDSDPDHLRQRFNILLVNDNQSSLEALKRRRGEIALVTFSHLAIELARTPALRQELLISPQFDNRYQLGVILRQSSAITLEEMKRLLDLLAQQQTLSRLWEERVPTALLAVPKDPSQPVTTKSKE